MGMKLQWRHWYLHYHQLLRDLIFTCIAVTTANYRKSGWRAPKDTRVLSNFPPKAKLSRISLKYNHADFHCCPLFARLYIENFSFWHQKHKPEISDILRRRHKRFGTIHVMLVLRTCMFVCTCVCVCVHATNIGQLRSSAMHWGTF